MDVQRLFFCFALGNTWWCSGLAHGLLLAVIRGSHGVPGLRLRISALPAVLSVRPQECLDLSPAVVVVPEERKYKATFQRVSLTCRLISHGWVVGRNIFSMGGRQQRGRPSR